MVLVRPEDHKIPDGSDASVIAVKIKTPKRVLQFSDGVLEEYSTDDEESYTKHEPLVDLVSTFYKVHYVHLSFQLIKILVILDSSVFNKL